jgi:predicted restriction endonuclease
MGRRKMTESPAKAIRKNRSKARGDPVQALVSIGMIKRRSVVNRQGNYSTTEFRTTLSFLE